MYPYCCPFLYISENSLVLPYKSRHILAPGVLLFQTRKGGINLSTKTPRYEEDFKRTLVELYHNGKTQTALIKEYGVSQSALGKWIKQYSTVETDNGEIITAKQVKQLQKRNAQLEEENLILKKAIAIFTPHSDKD